MVEWKKLGDIASVSNGERPTSDILEVGMYPYINAGRTNSGYLNDFNSKSGAITTPSHGEGGIGCVLFQYHDFWCGALCYKMYTTKGVEGRYLYHYLSNNTEKIINCKNVGGQPYINRKQLENIVIGVPSLSEQQRIVGILDTFTASIDNLKEQIAQRRKQYEYYRDQLLDLEGKEGVEMKTLGEIGEFIRGNGIQKTDFVDEGFGCIHYGQIHAKYGFSATETISKIGVSLYNRCKKAKKEDVVLATTSEDAEGVAKPFVWLGEEDAAVSGDAFIFHHNQNGKFMGNQFLTHRFMQFKLKYATGAKVVRISGENMSKFEVPLPSIEEQSHIVSILDTFESSITNLESQLSQREKQYEYYRNKLLTFE